jgi:DNA-binding beta-propeller fold protein YncE
MNAFFPVLFLLMGLFPQSLFSDRPLAPTVPKRLALVSNLMSHTLAVVDLDGPGNIRNFDIGRYPIFSSLHPNDPTKLIVALHNYDRLDDQDGIVLFDIRREKIVKKVPIPGVGMPSGFVYDRKRNRIYVADENLNRVFVLDGMTLDIIFALPAGLIPVHVDISPDDKWLVVTNRKSADLYVYDLDNILNDTKTGIYSIHLGPAPGCLWDPDEAGSAMTSHPIDVKFGNETNVCYVTDCNTKELLFVDIMKLEVVTRVAFKDMPFDFSLNREKTLAYVCQVGGESIAVVDLVKRKILTEIPGLVSNPIHCVLDEERNQLIVGCWGGARTGGIYVIDLKTYQIQKHFPLEGAAASIGITIVREQ